MSGLRLKAGVAEAEILAVLRDKHGLMGFSYPTLQGLLESVVVARPQQPAGVGLPDLAKALCAEADIKRYDIGITQLTTLRSDGLIDDDDKLTAKGKDVLLEMAHVMEYRPSP